MPSCCVPGCKSRFLNNNSNDIQFFRFPSKRPEQCAQWSRAIGRGDWQFTKWSKICSLHFAAKDYSPRFPGVIRYLRRDAIPSLLIPSGSPSDYESDDCENSSMMNGRFFETTTRSNTEATQSVISTPTPIALIKVAAAQGLSVSLTNQRQTGPNRRESNGDVNGKRPEAVFFSHEISEAFSILPDEESDASTNEKRPEPDSILPDDESDTFINEKRPEPIRILSDDESDTFINEKRPEPIRILSDDESVAFNNEKRPEPISILPYEEPDDPCMSPRTPEPVVNSLHELSNPVVRMKRKIQVLKPRDLSEAVVNGNRTGAAYILPKGVSTTAGKEKTTEPINILAGKETAIKSIKIIKDKVINVVGKDDTEPRVHLLSAPSSNGIANKQATGMVNGSSSLKSIGENAKMDHLLQPIRNNLRTIKPKTISSRSESEKVATNIDEAAKDINVNSGHHTIRIIPVEASDPILAIHCPLSCQETYMALPCQSLARKNNSAVEMEGQTAPEKSLNVNTEKASTQKENFNELSEIQALKKEIAKLNRTIGRQRKRLQGPVQMRELRKRQKRN